MRPLGVGINLQPNAVRELYDLGFTQDDLDRVGLPAKEWALVGLNGNDIYSEPRGFLAGYNWPQYAVHRGLFYMLLYEKLMERMGPEVVRFGSRVTGFQKNPDGSVTAAIPSTARRRSDRIAIICCGAFGRFSNRPFGVKHFQTIHHCSVDVSRGLVLLFGIGTRAVPPWDSRTRRNNLTDGLAVK